MKKCLVENDILKIYQDDSFYCIEIKKLKLSKSEFENVIKELNKINDSIKPKEVMDFDSSKTRIRRGAN